MGENARLKNTSVRWDTMILEGDYVFEHGHCLRLQFSPWKRAAFRPCFLCVWCGASFWATARVLTACPGE